LWRIGRGFGSASTKSKGELDRTLGEWL